MFQRMLGQTCQIFKPAKATDGFGDPRDQWPTTAASTVACRLQLASGREDTNGKDVALGTWKLFLPPAAVINEHDRVRVDGRWFEVESVYPVHAPRVLHHFEVSLTTSNGVSNAD